jgi:uncharacterized protein YjeT (DUF2065 family)
MTEDRNRKIGLTDGNAPSGWKELVQAMFDILWLRTLGINGS